MSTDGGPPGDARVRIHTGGAAEQSALDAAADAHTVGHDIGFGSLTGAGDTVVSKRVSTVTDVNNALTLNQTFGVQPCTFMPNRPEPQNCGIR